MKTPKKTIPEFVQRAESMLPMFKTSSNRPQPTAAPPQGNMSGGQSTLELISCSGLLQICAYEGEKRRGRSDQRSQVHNSSCNAFKYPVSGWV
jgi:hypothetical protein